MKLQIKKLDPRAKLPTYAHPGDAGLDIYTLEEVTIKPGERQSIKTGIALAIPDGYVGLVWDKSGLAFKYGLKSMAGVIDAGYRGELMICLFNTSSEPYTFKSGEKLVQLLIQKVDRVEIEEVDELDNTSRSDGRWGSTGK